MARIQIDQNHDGDAMLPGGRSVTHRLSIVLSNEDRQKIAAGESVKVEAALPNITVRHLFLTMSPE